MLNFWRCLITGHPKRALRQARYWLKLRNPQELLRLHIGCGQRRLPGFVNIDRNYSRATDYVGDASKLPCKSATVEQIETYHVIEHIPRPSVQHLLAEWFRVLKPGGNVVIECPDFDQAVREYFDGNEERLYSIYGRQRFPGDAHHWGYNAERLRVLLESVGFTEVVQKEPRDYHKDSEPCLRIECVKPSPQGKNRVR